MGLIVEALDCGFPDGAVHAFDLAVGPRVPRLDKAVVDVVLGAGILERVGPDRLAAVECQLDVVCRRTGVSGRGEVGAVVSQGHGLDQRPQEVSGNLTCGLLVQLDVGKFRGAIDSYQEIELSLFGSDLGNVDAKVAKRVGFDSTSGGLVAVDIRKP